MALQKNIASQKWKVFAFDVTTGVAKTGDAANITAKIAKSWAAPVATNDVNPTETEDGYYLFDLTQAETNADNLDLYPESSTANIAVIGVPGSILTSPASFPDDVVQTGDTFVRVGAAGIGLTAVSLAATGLDAISSTAIGMIEIAKAVWDRILTGATHNIATSAGRRVRTQGDFGSYLGRVHVDTIDGDDGTVVDENGTSDNPVDLWVSARTIAPNVGNSGLKDYHIINGSDILLSDTSDGISIFGDNYSLGLESRSCVNIHVEGATVSGIGTAATGEMHFEGCSFLTTASVEGFHADFTRFAGTVTFTLAGDYQIHNCYSGVAGPGGPTFAFGAVAISAEFRDFEGSINFTGLTSDDTITVGGRLGTVDLGSPASAVAVEIRGTYKEIINKGSAVINLGGALQGDNIADILLDTAEIGIAGIGLTAVSLAATGLDAIVSTAIGMVEIAKAIWDRILPGNHNINGSAGKILRLIGGQIFAEGTAQSGGDNNIQLEAGDVTFDGQFRRSKIILTGGTGEGQEAIITSSVAATDQLTTTPQWGINPDVSTKYNIVPAQTHSTVRNGGYDNGFVYIDKNGSNSGQEKGVDGTSTNPVNDEDDAYAIAANENLTKFMVAPDSAVVLPASSTNKTFEGSQYTVDLNGADIDNSVFNNVKTVFGTAIAGLGNAPFFTQVAFFNATLPPCNGLECGFAGTFKIGSAGIFTFGRSAAVFDQTFILDYNVALNSSVFIIQGFSGGDMEIQNAGAGTGTYKLTITGAGHLTINANCSADTIVDYHEQMVVTNNATGITIENDGNMTIAEIMAGGDIDGFSLENVLKLIAAAAAGDVAGAATTTMTLTAVDGSKVRVTATVDEPGNRDVTAIDVTG